ncbi:MAG: hypothetical protein ACYC3L_11295 [Gemmatimonadaceae bacterium]
MCTPRLIVSLAALVLGLTGSISIAAGQEPSDSVMVARVTPRWTTGSINVQSGAARLGLSELNATLVANGRPAFSTDVATFGISGYARFGRLVLGGSSESALPQRRSSAGWRSTVSFGSAMLDAGIVLVDAPHLLVYPQVSLGMRMTSLRIAQRGDFSYDEGTANPARGVSMSSLGALSGLGVVAEMRLASRLTGDFAIGLRAGLVQPMGGAATLANESTVTGTPREGPGRYLRLSIGKPIGKRRDTLGALSTAMLTLITR